MNVSGAPCELLELSADSARAALLRSENYCNFDLPDYFDFSDVIATAHESVAGLNRRAIGSIKARDYDRVNFLVAHNKDGRLSWRPWTLIHPVIYAALVDELTKEANWELIKRRIHDLKCEPDITCTSRPIVGVTSQMRKEFEVHRWWTEVEQASIESALNYSHVVQTDISSCYQSLYTHSIAWALHKKEVAKKNKGSEDLIGNVIDKYLQDMRQGQTNGIPQGSVLMDLIAECVLAYADLELFAKAYERCDGGYKILRHRDDYRIFADSPRTGEEVLKALADVLTELGMSLNAEKTISSDDVIGAAVKRDKLSWQTRNLPGTHPQKKLLALRSHALEYPNGGSVEVGLQECYDELDGATLEGVVMSTISIVVDIAIRNPRSYPIAASLISKLIGELEGVSAKHDAMRAVEDRFRSVPRAELMHVWINRVGLKIDYDAFPESFLCRAVKGQSAGIWEHEWICDPQLESRMSSGVIVDKDRIANLPELVSKQEVESFSFVYDG